MPTIIGVRFKRTGKIYYFDPANLDIKAGDGVIVETIRGVEYGDVVIAPKEVSEDKVVAPLKEVIRVATEEDHEKVKANAEKEESALKTCEEKIKKHNLPMSLVDVEYTFDGKKIVFYFTADGRVDFRDLVKDLAGTFRTRIELRQIGVRDEAKMLGGLGSCGREVCCKSYMGDFHPVSIRMAKDQNISLNPSKISGLCGRLMCCLQYEHDFYRSVKGKLKKVGAPVMTPDGPGHVMSNLVLQERCKVKVILPGENFELMSFPFDDVKVISEEELDKAAKEVAKKPYRNPLFKNPYETWEEPEKKEVNRHQNKSNNKPKNAKRRRRRRKKSPGKPANSNNATKAHKKP